MTQLFDPTAKLFLYFLVDQDDIVPPKYRDDVRKMIYHIPFDGTPEEFEVDEDQVSYHLFTRTNVDNYINIDVSNPTQLNTTKKLIFIIHGWTENRSRRWYEELKNALLEKDDVFVVQVDYSEPASHGYLTAVTLAPKVGESRLQWWIFIVCVHKMCGLIRRKKENFEDYHGLFIPNFLYYAGILLLSHHISEVVVAVITCITFF